MNPLKLDKIDPSVRQKVYTQNYIPKETINGVKIVQLSEIAGEDSDFSELLRINAQGECEDFPGFHIAQINRSTQLPNSIKAWHLHLSQDEVWYVPDESRLLTALWDIRADSPTKGMTMRIPMGAGSRKMVLIPHGVAHGSANFSAELGIIIYFMNSQFNIKNPDEHRIPWDARGADFWQPQRD